MSGSSFESSSEEPLPDPVFVDQSGLRGRLLRGLGWPVSVIGAVLAVAMGSSLVGLQADAPAMGIPAQPSLSPGSPPSPSSATPGAAVPAAAPGPSAPRTASPSATPRTKPSATPSKPSATTPKPSGAPSKSAVVTPKPPAGKPKPTASAPKPMAATAAAALPDAIPSRPSGPSVQTP
ncbi:hypothetical protein [Streptomyces sp. NPDC058401]|uniref:hypothetical protein n=1 Tax=Streptomyces sp. NPDC058401 TaxID=3346480 RepID=UPI0036579E0F